MPDSNPIPKLPETARQTSPLIRLILTALFLALLAGSFVLNKINRDKMVNSSAPPLKNPTDALKRYGFVLTESAKSAGITFVHTAPLLDTKLAGIRERIADMGAGIAVADFDNDGNQDFYVTNSGENSQNALYKGDGHGHFVDVAKEMHVADLNTDGTGTSMGALWGDFDNDGYEDLLVYKWGKPRLFHNDAGKGFTDVTEKANLPQWMNANSALIWDYDGDGKLDILLAGYFDDSLDLWHLKTTKIMPDSLQFATNGARKFLLKGNGDMTFRDVTAEAGLDSKHWTLGLVAADIRGTGRPDLFIANDYGYCELWLNEGVGKLRSVDKVAGLNAKSKSGMNAALGDVLNNGKPGIYVSNISEESVLLQGNNFWSPKTITADGTPIYENLAGAYNIELGGWSFGAQFGDLNNDGFLDLYLVNGYISGKSKDSYWYDYMAVSGGNAFLVQDAARWYPIRDRSLSGYQHKRVWMNDGVGHFNDIALAVGATDTFDGRSVAFIDADNDGALDVLVGNQRGPVLFYKNTVDKSNPWIGFKLAATKSNRSAIGAQVRLFFDKGEQVQEIHGGSGFCAQNQRPLHFGLGKGAKIEKVLIRWPSGVKQILTAAMLKLDQYNTVTEP